MTRGRFPILAKLNREVGMVILHENSVIRCEEFNCGWMGKYDELKRNIAGSTVSWGVAGKDLLCPKCNSAAVSTMAGRLLN